MRPRKAPQRLGHDRADADARGFWSTLDRPPSRLTERFYRVSSSRSRETGGRGLGLSIVKHVLALHEARLQVASEPGKGSTFACVFGPDRVLQPERQGV